MVINEMIFRTLLENFMFRKATLMIVLCGTPKTVNDGIVGHFNLLVDFLGLPIPIYKLMDIYITRRLINWFVTNWPYAFMT